MPRDCDAAQQADELGHLSFSRQQEGCGSRRYNPGHDPATATPLAYPER
jgi:hypothetical protein